MNKTTKTNTAQLEAVQRYQKKAERWTVTAKADTTNGKLLTKAKASGRLPEAFWRFLQAEFGDGKEV